MTRTPLVTLFSLSMATVGWAQTPQTGPIQAVAPAPVQVGQATHLATIPAGATTGTYTVLATGVTTSGLSNPLAYAMENAPQGSVIAIDGSFPWIYLSGNNLNNPNHVVLPGGAVLQDLVVVTRRNRSRARIRGMEIGGDITTPGGGGIENILFKDVTFDNTQDNRVCILTDEGSKNGTLRLYDVDFQTAHPGSFAGFGMKWNVRGAGRASYDLRDLSFASAQEHSLYLDSVNAANQAAISVFLRCVQRAGTSTGRTGIQIVNRANQFPGPPGINTVLIKDCYFNTNNGGGGGGAITCAGHLGLVWVESCTVDTSVGALAFYSDPAKGLYTNANGYVTNQLIITDLTVNGLNADRSACIISGVEDTQVRAPFQINSNKTAFDVYPLSPAGLHSIGIGTFCFDVPGAISQYPGFNVPIKAVYQGIVIPDAILDLFTCP